MKKFVACFVLAIILAGCVTTKGSQMYPDGTVLMNDGEKRAVNDVGEVGRAIVNFVISTLF